MPQGFMNVFISLIMAVVPAALLVIYYYRQDIRKKEPKGLVIRIFLLGIAAVAPVSVMELLLLSAQRFFFLPFLLPYFFKAFVVAALCEETIKLLIVKRFAYRSPHFDEVMDGIVYTVVASLGFACMENVLYVLNGGLLIALTRAFTAVPMHAATSGIMGYYIGKAKFSGSPEKESSLIFRGLLTAVVIHGSYNFLLFSMPALGTAAGLGIFPLLAWALFFLREKIISAVREDAEAGRAGQALPSF
jgi:protease PrsW